MAVTISDVAREAGVSTSTVSKVLNHWTTISPATINKVNETIARLHYTPNSRAVSFASQKSKNIIFLTSLGKEEAYHNPQMFDIMCGVHSELNQAGYSVTLVDTSTESKPGETVARTMAQKYADGIVVHGSAITAEVGALILSQNFPHIIIGHPGFESQLCWVDTNHALAGQFAGDHMAACGYKSVAFIGGRKTDYISMQRQKGFLAAMSNHGSRIPHTLIKNTDSGKTAGYRSALELLQSDTPPRAFVCENNTVAIGVLNAIESMHLSIPDEVALLTFNAYPYTEIMEPAPTYVDINVYDMGVHAGNMMIRKLEEPSLQIQTYTTLPVVHLGETTRLLPSR